MIESSTVSLHMPVRVKTESEATDDDGDGYSDTVLGGLDLADVEILGRAPSEVAFEI